MQTTSSSQASILSTQLDIRSSPSEAIQRRIRNASELDTISTVYFHPRVLTPCIAIQNFVFRHNQLEQMRQCESFCRYETV